MLNKMLFKNSLLQRYLFKELCSVFFLSFFALLSLVLIGRGLQLKEMFVGLDIGFLDILYLFLCLTPFFLLLILPVSCMLSVFLSFLRLSTDRELIALKAGGISLKKLLPAPLFFCLLCSAVTVYVSFFGISWGMAEFRITVINIAKTKAKVILQPGVFNKDIPGITLFAKKVDLQHGTLTDVIVEDRTHDDSNLIILAPKGSLDTDEQKGEVVFKLYDGNLYRTVKDQISVLGFKEYNVYMSLAEIFKDLDLGDVRPKEMSWTELRKMLKFDYADDGNNEQRNLRKIEVEMQKRIVFPIACLILGFFAIPIACSFEGVNRQVGVLVAMFMFFLYYSLLSFGISIAESGVIPPLVSLWLPNIIFLSIGIFWFRKALQDRSPDLFYWFRHLLFSLKKVSGSIKAINRRKYRA